jgi:hypothetical protein
MGVTFASLTCARNVQAKAVWSRESVIVAVKGWRIAEGVIVACSGGVAVKGWRWRCSGRDKGCLLSTRRRWSGLTQRLDVSLRRSCASGCESIGLASRHSCADILGSHSKVVLHTHCLQWLLSRCASAWTTLASLSTLASLTTRTLGISNTTYDSNTYSQLSPT